MPIVSVNNNRKELKYIEIPNDLTSGSLYSFSVLCMVILRVRCENFTSINFLGFNDRCQYLGKETYKMICYYVLVVNIFKCISVTLKHNHCRNNATHGTTRWVYCHKQYNFNVWWRNIKKWQTYSQQDFVTDRRTDQPFFKGHHINVAPEMDYTSEADLKNRALIIYI